MLHACIPLIMVACLLFGSLRLPSAGRLLSFVLSLWRVASMRHRVHPTTAMWHARVYGGELANGLMGLVWGGLSAGANTRRLCMRVIYGTTDRGVHVNKVHGADKSKAITSTWRNVARWLRAQSMARPRAVTAARPTVA